MPADAANHGGTTRVLHVDGDPAETRRVAAALERTSGPADLEGEQGPADLEGEQGPFEVVTETDARAGISRLATDDVDCLVTGYDLPGMDGVEFLETVRETHAEVPVVLFTGSGDEAVASRAISAGVTDYVRKGPEGGGLDALVERIEALTDDGEATPDARYDEAQLERFVAAFPDVVFVIDEEGRSIDLVAGGDSSLLYRDPEELIGRRFHDVYPAETADRFLDTVRRAIETGERQRIEYQLDVQAGTRWFEARVGPVDADGDGDTAFWIARDITERKRREREYERIFNEVDAAITVHDPAARSMVDVNETMADWTGYDRGELLAEGIGLFSATDQGFTVDRAYDVIEQVADSGEDRTIEWKMETAEGTHRWLESRATTATIGGERRVLGISRDITEMKRRRREYEQIFNGVNDSIVVHDPETAEMVDVNETLCELLGYDRETILELGTPGLSVQEEGFTPDQAEEIIDEVMESGEVDPFEWKVETSDGDHRLLEVTATRAEIGGEPRHVSIMRDITERRRREREYEQIFDGVNDAIAVHDTDTGDIVEVNDTYVEMFGYDRETILSRGVGGLSATDTGFTKDRADGIIARVAESGEPEEHEWQIETADGERRVLESTVTATTVGGERRVLTINRDVTDRRRRQRQLETIVERIDEAIYLVGVDEGRGPTFLNQAYEDLTGLSVEQLQEDPDIFTEHIHPDDRERYVGFLDRIEREIAAGDTRDRYDIEYRFERPDGETRWHRARGYPLQDSTQYVYIGVLDDITERKRREREYEQIFDGVNDAIAVFDPDAGEITEVNDAYREMLGYDLERIRELGIDGLSASEEGYTGERGWELIREVAETGDSETVEWRAEAKEGDRIWLEATLAPAEIGGEQRVLSIQRDITERRELQRTYRDIFEGVSDGLLIHDPETGEILEVNERYCEITGYDREELLDGSMESIMPEDSEYTYDAATERIRKAREEGPQLFEFKGERKNGEEFIGDVHLRTIEIRGNERVLASVRDITERKRRQQEYEQIFNGVNDAIVIQDPETAEPMDANETFLDRLGYDDVAEIREEGMEGLSAVENGYTAERARELCHRVMETGEPEVVEWQQETKDGDRRWIEGTIDAAVIRGEDRVLSIQRDITGRKRRERAIEALQTATERLQRAETAEEVASVAVESASDLLDLPMAVCWFHDAGSDRLDPVVSTDAANEAGLVSGLSADRYEYAVFEKGTVTEYTPAEHGPDNPLEAGVLLPLGEHGLVAAGRRTETGRVADGSVLDIAGALAEHATTALDRVERARELRESERRFRLIAERIDEVIYLATPDFSEVLYVNPAYESIWGRPVDELYDDARQLLAAVDPRDKAETEAGVRAMVEEMQHGDPADSYEFEYRIRQPDGEIRWVNATGYAVEMADGERRFVGIVDDITERKNREQRLEVFNRILRHNLRNQLDVIRSHAETLADRPDDGEDHADRIIAAVDELAAMGARARKTDRIMSMDDEVTEVDLPETLREAVETVAPGRGIVDVTTDLPRSAGVSTNREALYTGVKSALENAIEHADSEVSVTVEERPNGYTVLIDDDGPGIPPEELTPIEAGTETNLQHGRGLGLWQLRWGVDKLNGELSFDTDDGTTIRIAVPDHTKTER